MIRKAFVMTVRPDAHDEYRRRHDAIWPELAAVLRDHGVRSYTIYLDPGRSLLFASVELESPGGVIGDADWATTLDINVTANHRLADEAAAILRDQALDVSIVLTSSANAVVAKRGSEAYDVSRAALSHLVRELAISLAPSIRVNGISPATVIAGSSMFPRDRMLASLARYDLPTTPTPPTPSSPPSSPRSTPAAPSPTSRSPPTTAPTPSCSSPAPTPAAPPAT
jgi:L-rhamnose mutarotase